ncbi:MAG: B12-binding domain-containing protein, partial [Vulcanimicrobiaceae bacterium]
MLTSALRPRGPLAALPFHLGDDLVASLRDAVDLDTPALFTDVIGWAYSLIAHREGPQGAVDAALRNMMESLGTLIPQAHAASAREMLDAARAGLTQSASQHRCAIDVSRPNGSVAERILRLLLDGDEQRASRALLCCIANGTSQSELYAEVITPLLHETGRLWEWN